MCPMQGQMHVAKLLVVLAALLPGLLAAPIDEICIDNEGAVGLLQTQAAVQILVFCAQYDWTTGVPDNGNEWRKFRAVPRSYPLRSLVFYFVYILGVETEGLLDYQGRAGIISIVRWNVRTVLLGVEIS